MQQRLKPFIGDSAFYKQALMVMIPVIVQQLISTLFNVIDNFMVGQLDAISMAAVSVANKPTMIYSGCFVGMAGGAGLMLSQYFGAKEFGECQSIFSVEMLVGIAWSILFCAVMVLFPETIMGIFVSDMQTIEVGASYIRIASFSFIPAAVSMTCIFSMRALGYNRMPMIISVVSMLLNGVFNYCFIFGHFGAPEMGVEGAALGTLLARSCEMLCYLVILAKRSAFFTLEIKKAFTINKEVLKTFVKKAFPLTVNEVFWTTGFSIFFWAYASLNEVQVPAITIADLVVQVGQVISVGMASAVAVLIGTRLGAGEFREAKDNTKKLLSLVLVLATLSMLLAFAMSFTLPSIFNVSDELKELAKQLSWIGAAFYIPNAIYCLCFFCLRAGGDTKNVFFLDSVYMWLLPVPVAVLMATFGQGSISVIVAMFAVQLLMNAKVFLSVRALRQGKWVRNITTGSTV